MSARFIGKRIVVTGGAGFIGSHLVDALLDEGAAHVAVVDTFFLGKEENLDESRRRHGDHLSVLREDAGELTAMAAVMDKIKPDLVFNLATKALLYSFFNPAGACRVNLDIAIALAELQRQGAYGRLVHFSSSEVYGSAQRVPMDENHPLLAETSYAAGKAAGDLLLVSYVNMFGADISLIRPFNNYGPRQNDGQLAAIIPLTLRKIREGGQPMIQGDGLQTRDFIYVGDTVESTLKLALRDDIKGRVLNLGSGRETSIKAIIDGISAEVGYTGGIDWQPARAADVRRHWAGVDAATALIGPVAPTGLEEGLKKTIAWYRGRPS
ncbi:MAG: putative UDP-glucose [Rhodospirillaceae bacterium]|nr:MAG: putative UDP-glucose [Rhodospirillaceae bacterium]TNC97473.1 MAG: putative UDP-glucose 4-epimerase [Stygiobacter sp.]